MSQRTRILDYMKSTGSITPVEAFSNIGCFRLAARIAELRKEGHSIETLRETNNMGKTYARYVFKPKQLVFSLFEA